MREEGGLITKFINCTLLRGDNIVKDDLWIRGGRGHSRVNFEFSIYAAFALTPQIYFSILNQRARYFGTYRSKAIMKEEELCGGSF